MTVPVHEEALDLACSRHAERVGIGPVQGSVVGSEGVTDQHDLASAAI